MNTNTQQHPMLDKEVGFCPDLDRGALFQVTSIENTTTKMVKVTLKYIRGRWNGNPGVSYVLPILVPTDFTQEDLAYGWFGIPPVGDTRWVA